MEDKNKDNLGDNLVVFFFIIALSIAIMAVLLGEGDKGLIDLFY